MYLAWFDADRKKPVAQKIAEAHERYLFKFGRAPLVCLVNPEDVIADSPIELRPLSNIGRNCFWIGMDERDEPEPAPEPVAAPAPTDQPRRAKRQRRIKVETTVTTELPAPTAIPEAAESVPAVVQKARRPRRERTAA
jgi:hypothetical protein